MKMVQEHLKGIEDITKFLNYYFYKFPIPFEEFAKTQYTVQELNEKIRYKMIEYITYLQNLQIQPSKGIILAYPVYGINNFRFDKVVTAFDKNELIDKKEQAAFFGFMMTPQAEVMGYKIADTEYTQDNITDVLVYILYELQLLGMKQEKLSDLEKSLENAVKNTKEHPERLISSDEMEKRLFKEFGYKKRKLTEEEKQLKDEYINKEMELNEYYRKAAIRELLELIDKEKA